MTEAEAVDVCREVMLLVSKRLAPHFRIHSEALHGEVAGTKLTTERWNRVLAVLNSLRSLPGELMSDSERECRSHGLRAIALVERMYHVATQVGDTSSSLRFVSYFSAELKERMAQPSSSPSTA